MNDTDTYTNNRTGDQFQCLENTTFFDGSGRMVTTLVPIQKEPERWRAKRNGWYWYVDSDLIPRSLLERGTPSDEGRHDTNNYFSSQNQAQLAADAIRELLKVIHEPDLFESDKHYQLVLTPAIDKARAKARTAIEKS